MQVSSPGWGLQNPSSLSGQFGRKSKNPKSRVFTRRRRTSSPISLITGNNSHQCRSEMEEEEEVKGMGPVARPEVAGRPSSGEKKGGRGEGVAREERESGERREKEMRGFSRKGNPKN